MLSMKSSLLPMNEFEWSVNDFRPCFFGNTGPVQPNLPIIDQSAASLGEDACNNIMKMF